MYEAIKNSDLQFIKSHKINERYKVGRKIHTSICDAIELNRMDVFNLLMQMNADVNVLSGGATHPCKCAVINNNNEALKKLISRIGCKMYYKDFLGYDAFYYAIKSQNIELIKTLVNHVDINAFYKTGKNILTISIDNKWEVSTNFLLNRFDIIK